MPGIVGIISQKPPPECAALARQMKESLLNENFYKSTSLLVPEMGIYAGIVGFEDAPDGIFSDEAGNVSVLFSGECFAGSRIVSGTEIIRLYQEEGRDFVKNLNGLFCGLLVDQRNRRVFLFNDRYGLQRIYYHERQGIFYFAGEVRALLRVLPEQRQFDEDGLTDFLAFGSVSNWKTLFRGIDIMPGGSRWTFENATLRKENYFSAESWESLPPLSAAEFEDRFQQMFKQILPRYFESPSQVGIALTGGLDTRMIMACRPNTNGHATCYTFTGSNGKTLDDQIAARVAAASNLEHQLLRLEQDFFSNFAAHADKTIFATDGCAGVFHAHEIYLNRKAREVAPIRLTGNYGSEILRGHSTFKPLGLSPQLFDARWRTEIRARGESLAREQSNPFSFAAFREIPWHLYGNLAAGRSQLRFRSPFLDNELVALAFQTPASLRRSSLPSFRLVRANNKSLGEIPTDRGFGGTNAGLRFLARRAFAEVTFKLDYYTVAGLPGPVSSFNPIFKPLVEKLKIAGMHKFVRYSDWFRNDLAPCVRDILGSMTVRNNGIWDRGFIDRLATAHIQGRHDYSAEINAVLTLESIERQFLKYDARENHPDAVRFGKSSVLPELLTADEPKPSLAGSGHRAKEHVSVCLCTFKRPLCLKRTLENLRCLETENLFDYSIVVVDNDQDLSAREVVANFSADAPVKITYAVEPEQNISLARNKALQLSAGHYVAWIDDDEFPARDWLLSFYKVLKDSHADGALGPVEPCFEDEPPPWVLRGRFFEKKRGMATGSPLRWEQTSTANAIVRRAIFKTVAQPFRRQFGSGCEDVDFFRRMMETGHTFVWCREAVVHEVIPPARWRRRYLFRRALLRGQNNRHFAGLWGVAKSVVALPCYLLLLPFLLAMGQHFFVSFLMKIGDHAGKLLGLAGLNVMGDKYLAENPGNS